MQFKIEAQELKDVLDAACGFRDEILLDLKASGILLRIQDESNSALYSSFIPTDAMESYTRGEEPKIGVYAEEMANILPSNDQEAIISLTGGGKIEVMLNNKQYKMPPIDPDHVAGVPDQVPDLDLPVTVVSDASWLTEFIQEAHSYVHNSKEGGGFFLSANEGLVHLFSKRDDYQLKNSIHWEDFEDYDIEWQRATPDAEGSMGINPTEEKRIECLLSLPLTKAMTFYSDTVEFSWGNGMPIKAVSESDNGIKHSWIIPPRFPKQSEIKKIPDDVLEERSIV